MRLLTKRETAELLGLHPGGLVRKAKAEPSFPQPIRLGDKHNSSTRFVAEEVEAWLVRLVAARPGRSV